MAELILELDRTSPVPLYFQVAQQLERAIEDGRMPPGTRLDNEIQLAEQLGMSRPTLRRAMQHLVDKGLVVRRRGIGTRVVQPKVRRSLELTSLYDDLEATARRPTTRVLANEVVPASDEAAEALGLDPDSVFKTLVVSRDGDLAVCIVPAGEKLHLQALGKRAEMAPTDRAERVTGYVAGGISPLGQRRPLPTFVDEWAMVHDTIFVSAGRRGLEIELAPGDLVELTGAEVRALT